MIVVTVEIRMALAHADTLKATARECTPAQAALQARLGAAADALEQVAMTASRALSHAARLEREVYQQEMLARLAQALLEEARVAAEGGHPAQHGLHRQARELIGAALDRCKAVSS
jgi:hypothetical protein